MSALPSLDRADRAAVGADAAGALYERYGSRIFAFCLSRLGNREEAEDATQTTFLNAFRSLHGGIVPRYELAWLFRIADNVCRDRRKSAWRRGRIEATRDLHELQDLVTAPERRSDGLVGLEAALAAMPDRQRRAILLREWQGLSYQEIAGELGLSKAAVETLIFRARRSLARALEAPQARRAHAGLDAGWLLALAKSLFHGGGAVKVATSVAAVACAGLLVAAPLQDRGRQAPPARNDVRTPSAQKQSTRVAPAGTNVVSERPAPAAHDVVVRRPAGVVAQPDAQGATVPRATAAASVPRGKAGEPPRAGSTPAPPAPERPVPTADAPPSTPETAPSPPPAPPASLPSLPPVPELPPILPEAPPLEPPAIPPPPDLPVDLPGVPDLPGLP